MMIFAWAVLTGLFYILTFVERLSIREKLIEQEFIAMFKSYYSFSLNVNSNKKKIRNVSLKRAYIKLLLWSFYNILIVVPLITYFIISAIFLYNDLSWLLLGFIYFGIYTWILVVSLLARVGYILPDYDRMEKYFQEYQGNKYIETPNIFFIPYKYRYKIVSISYMLLFVFLAVCVYSQSYLK